MCIGKPECQRCETCGLRKYQFWVGTVMHNRGCPWGYGQMNECPDAVNTARMIHRATSDGAFATATGQAFCAQMAASGVDLNEPQIEWIPSPTTEE